MTGFFGITREAYKRAENVSRLGFKICMELYVKSKIKKHAEVSIVFGVRVFGESKLTQKVIIEYLKHLNQLYKHSYFLLYYFFILLILFVFFKIIKNKIL
jgi:dolichol-phosphate mannosyltransferase